MYERHVTKIMMGALVESNCTLLPLLVTNVTVVANITSGWDIIVVNLPNIIMRPRTN